jgi:hypothetical protein
LAAAILSGMGINLALSVQLAALSKSRVAES